MTKNLIEIEPSIKAQIDMLATKHLSNLSFDTPSFIMMTGISSFKFDLYNSNIIDEDSDVEDDEITHSPKLLIALNAYFSYGRDIARFVSYYFEVDQLYVTNQTTQDGIIFVGHVHNIYVASLVFEYISKIAAVVREKYWSKLKRYKNDDAKNRRANDYMDEWLEDLFDNDGYSTLNSYNSLYYRGQILYKDYIKKHFITDEDKRKVMLHAVEIIKLIYDYDEIHGDDKVAWSEFKQWAYKTFSEEDIQNTAKKVEEMQSQDIVMLWSKDEDDNYLI